MIDQFHRAKHRQLWIDRLREDFFAKTAGDMDAPQFLAEMEIGSKLSAICDALGEPSKMLAIVKAGRQEEYLRQHGLSHTPIITAAIEVLAYNGWPAARNLVDNALGWCGYNLALSPATRLMTLDSRTGQAVVDSTNEPITAAELQHLPYPRTFVEFSQPVELCESIRHGVRARGIGLSNYEADGHLAAIVTWYLDYWVALPMSSGRFPACLHVFFGGGITRPTMDDAAAKAIGITVGSPLCERIVDRSKMAARNLLDFLTMRTLNYERIKRKAAVYPVPKPQHTQGLMSSLDREVFHLYLAKTLGISEVPDGQKHTPQWGYRIEVPGKFHQLIYCAKCGDLHRHDLIGQPCRKCSDVVGPRQNLRVEKSWHPPYVVGPEHTPLKETVYDVKRKRDKR